jgi:MFS family permease
MNSMDLKSEHFYGWKSVSIGGLVIFLSMGCMFSFQLLLPVLRTEFGWSAALIGGASSVTMLALGLVSPLCGAIITKYGARKGIMAGNFFMAMGFLVMALQTKPWHLYLGYGVLVGIGASLGGILPAMTLANNWFIKKRSMAMSIVTFSSSIGGFAFLPVMSIFIGWRGWRAGCFIITAAILIGAVLIPWLAVKDKPEDVGQVPDGASASAPKTEDPAKPTRELYTTPVEFTLVEAIRTKTLWLIIYGFVTTQFLNSVMSTHQMAFLGSIGISGVKGAVAAGLMYGIGILGALGIGALGLRFNLWRLNIIAMGVIVAGCILLLAARTLTMVYMYNTVIGIGVGGFTTGYVALLSSYYGRTHFPKIMGIVFLFGTLLGASGSFVAGIFYDITGHYTMVFAVLTLIFLLGLLCIIMAKPPKHPSLIAIRAEEETI